MKKLLIVAFTSVAALTAIVSTADAAQGCGAGFHRGPNGYCRPNPAPGGAVVVVPGGPRVGVYYHGHGYWDGHRYWVHREYHRGGWRYY
ncbi:GCG_CRPN prefix-to-repeats domain-containing protein [Rhizobium jaguaris]|uniref:GCG_CRPN prefix-to-repeats domain-containing protein n=1 Tax=Rhizobium jaguaris TaxID=1312183 RepID=UPI0039BEE08E